MLQLPVIKGIDTTNNYKTSIKEEHGIEEEGLLNNDNNENR